MRVSAASGHDESLQEICEHLDLGLASGALCVIVAHVNANQGLTAHRCTINFPLTQIEPLIKLVSDNLREDIKPPDPTKQPMLTAPMISSSKPNIITVRPEDVRQR